MIHFNASSTSEAERSSVAMSRTFEPYRPRRHPRRHPTLVRTMDATILGVLALLVMVRWLVMEPPRASASVERPAVLKPR